MTRRRDEAESGAGPLGRPTSRRSFVRWGGAAVLATGALAGCDDIFGDDDDGDGGDVALDFSTDFGVLNYAFALEQLEAAFYTQVVAAAGFATTFPAGEQRILRDLRDHEVAHREFFRAAIPALGGTLIPDLTPDFGAVDFGSRTAVLQAARTFEDLGVAAYNGAGPLLSTGTTGQTIVTLAGKIVSVEARHAAAIRDLLTPRSSGANGFAPDAFDDALPPGDVLLLAAPFLRERLTARNVPTVA